MIGHTIRNIPRVFDRYMLPKVAFAVITGASMAGTILTGLRQGENGWLLLVLKWAAWWALAALGGAELWKIAYLRPSVRLRPVQGAVEYAEAMMRLHVRWQQVLGPAAALFAGIVLTYYAVAHTAARPWAAAAGLGLALALAGMVSSWRRVPHPLQHDGAALVTLFGLATALAAMAGLDVLLQDSRPLWLLAPTRMLHLLAFAAWLGGALWNIFVAVPAGLQRIHMDTVILANFQLERFRLVVRAVFPTIVVTGLVQAWAMFGWAWQTLFTSVWGWLLLTKIGLIVLLVGIFITCPMWKACSPIRGVCDLDDL